MGSRPFAPLNVPVTASIASGTANADRLTNARNREKNENFVFTGDANLRHSPEYFVGIFNVSDQEQRIERPWVMEGRMGKLIVIPAKEPGTRVSRPFLIPDIIQVPVERAGSWEMGTRGVDGKFLAQDALNPEDPRGNWKTVRVGLATALSNEGTNLYHMGLFWQTVGGDAKNPEPAAEDAIEMAVARMEATYNRWIEEANTLALQGADGIKQIGHTHRRAANYFGIEASWNKLYQKKNQCPNCGTAVPVTASRCFNQNCRFVFSWERALSEGTASVQEATAAGVMGAQAENMGKAAKGRKKATQP